MGILRASGDPRYEGRGTATTAKLSINPNAAAILVRCVHQLCLTVLYSYYTYFMAMVFINKKSFKCKKPWVSYALHCQPHGRYIQLNRSKDTARLTQKKN